MGGRCAVAAAATLWIVMLLARGADPRAPWLVALVLGWLAWRAPPRVGTVLALATLALAGAARAGAHRSAIESARAALAHEGTLHRVEATVVAPPQRASGAPEAVVAVTHAAPPIAAGARLRLRLPEGTAVAWGDRLHALAWVERPAGLRNPGGRDGRAAADAAGVVAYGRARVAGVTVARGPAAWARATVERWRGAIEALLASRLTPEARALVVPLVLGDRSAMPGDLDASFRAAGLVHLLALSGMHVSWLAGVARGLVACAGGGRVARAAAGLACALVYVGLAGPLASLARAAATEGLRCAAALAQRALDPLQALAVAVLALLAVAPGWAGDLGFQLSCAATAGIVTIGPRLAPPGALHGARALLGVTVAAQWTTLGLLLHHFHAFSWIAPFANLAAVPLAGLLLTAAWIAIVLDLALPGAGGAWLAACEALAAALTAVSDRAARAPSALVAAGSGLAPGVWAALGAALVAWSCAAPRAHVARRVPETRGRRVARACGVAATLLALLLAIAARPLAPPPGRFWVVVLDVGQGDAIALGFAGGWWLVDAGPRGPTHDAGERVVAPFLRWAAVRRLEALALTHDDLDHAGGAAAVRRAVAVERTIAPGGGTGTPGAARVTHPARGDTLWRDPTVAALWPPRDAPRAGEDNATGLVLALGRDAGRVVLLADVDSTIEARLGARPPVALVKVAHHGSGSSSGATFLAGLRPRVGAISCGRSNPFGHPDRGALARLAAAGVEIHRTDREGALWYEVGDGVDRLDWRRARPGRGHRGGEEGGTRRSVAGAAPAHAPRQH